MEGHEQSNKVLIAALTEKVNSIKESMDEMKTETKEFHKRQTEIIDRLAHDWQQFSGVIKMVSDNAERIRKLEDTVEDSKKTTDSRMKKLENWRTVLAGAAIVIWFLMSQGVLKIKNLF